MQKRKTSVDYADYADYLGGFFKKKRRTKENSYESTGWAG